MSTEYQLEKEIDRLQNEKLEVLRLAKAATGIAKTEYLDKFLELNREQEKLEQDLANLED